MAKIFKFKARVWRWPGDFGWHFVNLPKDLAKKIRKTGVPYGAGFIKVRVTLGKSTWVTALFPDKKSDSYIMSVKKQIRQKEGIWEDDEVNVSFLLQSPVVELGIARDTVRKNNTKFTTGLSRSENDIK